MTTVNPFNEALTRRAPLPNTVPDDLLSGMIGCGVILAIHVDFRRCWLQSTGTGIPLWTVWRRCRRAGRSKTAFLSTIARSSIYIPNIQLMW